MANSDDDDNDGKMAMTVMVVAMAIIANTRTVFLCLALLQTICIY